MSAAVTALSATGARSGVTADQLARELVRDLHAPRPATYWTDFLLTSIIGWIAFGFAVYCPVFSPGMALAVSIATFALYRGLLFVHEISHFTRGGMQGFETAWNLLSGFPLLLPSFVYCGVDRKSVV